MYRATTCLVGLFDKIETTITRKVIPAFAGQTTKSGEEQDSSLLPLKMGGLNIQYPKDHFKGSLMTENVLQRLTDKNISAAAQTKKKLSRN